MCHICRNVNDNILFPLFLSCLSDISISSLHSSCFWLSYLHVPCFNCNVIQITICLWVQVRNKTTSDNGTVVTMNLAKHISRAYKTPSKPFAVFYSSGGDGVLQHVDLVFILLFVQRKWWMWRMRALDYEKDFGCFKHVCRCGGTLNCSKRGVVRSKWWFCVITLN